MFHSVKRIASVVVVLLSFSFVLFALPELHVAKAEPKTIVVPDDFLSVFDAVEAASEGDTIYVKSGTYDGPVNQTLVIDKSLSLIGEDKSCTVLNFFPPLVQTTIPFSLTPVWKRDAPIRIAANNVTISGFTIDTICKTGMVKPEITGTGNNTRIVDNNILTGVYLKSGSHQTVTENNITGMLRASGSHQTITQNTVKIIAGFGIECSGSYNNITENNIYGSGGGIYSSGSHNVISENEIITESSIHASIDVIGDENVVANNNLTDGMGVGGSNNLVYANIVPPGFALVGYNNTFYANHAYGVAIGNRIKDSANNTFYHNNFLGKNPLDIGEGVHGPNFFDNGKEGNYWNDYNGTDKNRDGIGDTPYIINENSKDQHPLIAPITIFDAGTWEWTSYNVDVISNSTVSDFSFNPETVLLRFSVEGETGTTGFCRVTIPKDLLDTEDYWTVLVDGNPVTPTVNEEANNTYLYFTYQHSTKTVEIIGTDAIPEFPSWAILPLLLVASFAAIMCKQRLMRKSAKN
jgi:nitrous oxidase accessory protein NosD